MAQDDPSDLSQRIRQLEALVRGLTERMDRLDWEAARLQSRTPVSEPAPAPGAGPSPEEFVLDLPETDAAPAAAGPAAVPGEVWLQRIGIALLLLGVGFLVKYSIDRGWITPAVRLGMGFAVGVVLLQIGYRIREERDLLSQVLEGGAVAVFYMVGFAAYQWYQLVPHLFAYYYMVGVTVLTYIFCLRQDLPSLSVIGTLGGLGTPFLLHSGSGNLPGLVAYTCLVLTGALWIFYIKGWRPLFTAAFIGAWAVHGTELWILDRQPGAAPYYELVMQGGLLFTWLGFWWIPVLSTLWRETGEAGAGSTPEQGVLPFEWSHRWTHLPVALLGGALLTLYFSMEVWHLTSREWGYIVLAGALFYGLVSWRLHAQEEMLSWLHGLAAVALLTIALAYLLDGNALLISLAVEAAALHFFAHRLRAKILTFAGHALFLFAGLWLGLRLLDYYKQEPLLFNRRAWTDLGVLALAVATALKVPGFFGKRVYLSVAYVAVLLWWNRELDPLKNANAWVSIAWGLQGTLLFVFGLRRNRSAWSRAGFATLAVVALKMVLIDLAHLETLWRILLFLGIGAGFLGLSYLARDLWKPSPN